MRISDWSSDVCSSDLLACGLLSWASYQRLSGRPRLSAWPREASRTGNNSGGMWQAPFGDYDGPWRSHLSDWPAGRLLGRRSEKHTSELQSLMRNSYAVFCLKNKKNRISKETHTKKN